MVQGAVIVFEARPDVMRAFDFGDIDIARVLVISKLERATGAGVSDIGNGLCAAGPVRELKSGNALVIHARAIGAGDPQHIAPIVAVELVTVRANILARAADIAVENQSRRDTIGQASSSYLHA